MPDPRLVDLFQAMSDHTKPECATCKPRAYACCEQIYCYSARDYALETYGIELPVANLTGELPYMGPNGCTVPPHMRPLCTLHTCQINSLGQRYKGDGKDAEWAERYFQLRGEIDECYGSSSS